MPCHISNNTRARLGYIAAALAVLTTAGTASAATATYVIDPDHTFPSFEADHFGGMSIWRGKFNHSSGKILLDKAVGTGSVDIAIDASSIDTGQDALNDELKSVKFFDTAKYPQATYKGELKDFANGMPTRVVGQLAFHGVTRPVDLKINSFRCMPHPMLKREVCGADAFATIDREDFGVSLGKDFGFDMKVTLRIQVEAIQAE